MTRHAETERLAVWNAKTAKGCWTTRLAQSNPGQTIPRSETLSQLVLAYPVLRGIDANHFHRVAAFECRRFGRALFALTDPANNQDRPLRKRRNAATGYGLAHPSNAY